MITENQLHEAKGKELSLLLGEVLQPDMKHHVYNIASHRCKICDVELRTYEGQGLKALHEDCICPTPIPLDDWNVAMKWRDWAVEKFGYVKFYNAMRELWNLHSTHEYSSWYDFLFRCKPEHYLKAVGVCEIRSKA